MYTISQLCKTGNNVFADVLAFGTGDGHFDNICRNLFITLIIIELCRIFHGRISLTIDLCFVDQVNLNLNRYDLQQTSIVRGQVIRICYNTHPEVGARFTVGNVIEESHLDIGGDLFELSNQFSKHILTDTQFKELSLVLIDFIN